MTHTFQTEKLEKKIPFDTPIVFIIFNRPDKTERVFAEIARIKPRKLFVIADGPRPDRAGEAAKCAATRAVIDRVDWECDVFRNFSDTNMRGPWRISSGLDWVFSQVDRAIILEDDCMPAQSFFPFCSQLLERYRDDERIMMVSGLNLIPRETGVFPESYFFSKHPLTWGWATWKRAWDHFDLSMADWPDLSDRGLMDTVSDSPEEKRYFTRIFSNVHRKTAVHWDYAWIFAQWAQGGLCIFPKINMIANIGYGSDAMHTTSTDDPLADLKTFEMQELVHPRICIRNVRFDRLYFLIMFKPPNIFVRVLTLLREGKLLPAIQDKFRQLFTNLFARERNTGVK